MTGVMRSFNLLALAFALLLIPMISQANAQDAAKPEVAWQSVISGQINAFRAGDGVAALGFAGEGFRSQFNDPNAFVVAIAASGYAPIITSLSHTFGKFEQLDDKNVMQVVHFVGPNDMLYEAIYQLKMEADGWRVQGVALKKDESIAV